MSALLPAQERGLPILTCSAREQGETLLCFRFLTMARSCIVHGIACLYRRRCGDTRGDIAGSGLWLSCALLYNRVFPNLPVSQPSTLN